ncbi:hypothetical protein [Euzebya sp.]|uniref:hypothetical protein n=1 Tax=Euzebya sp. TaxID=1971409 RepID=UPI0035148BCA
MAILVITALGGAFALLLRRAATDAASTDLPDDVWAAFEASMAADQIDELPRPTGTAVTTVGGMAVGESGFVSSRAAAVDPTGALWLAATAVVHTVCVPGRVAVRRDAAGYHLQRHEGPVGVCGANLVELHTRVRVASRFD